MTFHDDLKLHIHKLVKLVYKNTKSFPKDEIYGITSQLRRASLSIMLNYVEGFARRKGDKCKVYKNFMEISYGSLKEAKYLLFLSFEENYLSEEEYKQSIILTDTIGKMLWGTIQNS